MAGGTRPRMGGLPYVAKRGLRAVFQRATFAPVNEVRLGRMSLRLSPREVAQLQGALKVLLSPLDFDSVGAWRAESRNAIAALVHAQTSVSFLPLEGEAPYQASREPNLAAYAEHFYTMDKTPQHSRAVGSHAFTWQTMRPTYERPGSGAWLKSEFYNDWVRPQRLCQPCGLIAVRSHAELRCPPFESFSGLLACGSTGTARRRWLREL